MATYYRTLALLIVLLLAACGGGEAEPEENAPKPLCKIDPTKQCPFVPSATP